MTARRDPWSVAAERQAARIDQRFRRRMAELERRPKTTAIDPEFARAADRLKDLRPVRLGLTRALRRGERAYVTTLNGIPLAYTKSGRWYTQEMVDLELKRLGA